MLAFIIADAGREGVLVFVSENDRGHGALPQVVLAGRAPGLFLGPGQRRKQERGKNGDDGDDDE